MSDIVLDVQSTPATPGSGQAVAYIDSQTKMLSIKDDAGFVRTFGRTNFSTAAQALTAATRTYLNGSALAIPTGKIQIGTSFRWSFNVTKTAAGTASSTYDIAIGTAGTTGDTARLSFTKPAGTADADEGMVTILAVVRSVGASGIVVAELTLLHNLASTGHAVIPCVVVTAISAGFDMTIANLIVGLCITTGAADAITIELVQAEAWNL